MAEDAPSLYGDGERLEGWASIATPRLRASGSAINRSLGRASRRKPRPKKTTTVAIATTPREIRWSRAPTLRSSALAHSFVGLESASCVLPNCEPEFLDASRCASSANNRVARIRRGIWRSRFPKNTSQDTTRNDDRKVPDRVIETELRVSVLVGGIPTEPFTRALDLRQIGLAPHLEAPKSRRNPGKFHTAV